MNNHRRRKCEKYYLVNYLTDEKHNLYPIIIASTNQPFNEVSVRRNCTSKSKKSCQGKVSMMSFSNPLLILVMNNERICFRC